MRLSPARAVVLVIAVAAVGSGVFFVATRDRTPLLTVEALERARSAWKQRGLGDYDITIRKDLDARPSEVIRTEVRGGKAARLTVNGNELPARDTYSANGIFDTADGELEMASSKVRVEGQPRDAILKAAFHAQYGIPLVLERIASGRQSYWIHVLRVESPGGQVVWEKP